MKKTINLASTKKSGMKLTELNVINRDPEFSSTWINSQKHILLLLTVGGIAVILLWQLLDKFYIETLDARLPWLRWIAIGLFGVNLFFGLKRKTPRAIKQHLVAGFYFGTLFCMLLAMFTGASQSPYWFGLFFIIVAWFVLVPYNFREMIIHSFIFVLMFIAGQYAQQEFSIVGHEMGKIIFLYSVALSVSFFATYIRNNLDASNFKIKKELNDRNRQLEMANEELQTEISARIKNERELRKFRLVLDQAPGAVFIMDKYSNFEYINPFFTQISGYTEEDLLHKNINETLYKGISEIPKSRKEIVKTLQEGKNWQGELLTIHKNGFKYWANTIASPFKNESGEMDGFIVIQQDITEKMNFEKAIRDSEAKYKTLVENSQDGIIITQNGKFKFVNKAMCRILGYSEEEFYNMDGADIIPESHLEKILKIHKDRMEGRITSLNYSLQLISKAKQIIDVEVQSTTVEFEGNPAAFMTLHDVTESKKMQLALFASEKKYRELAEMLPQSVYELDPKGDITYMNQTGLHKFGITFSDYGRPAFDFIAPEHHAQMKENMLKSLTESYHTQGTHYTAVKNDGTKFPVMIFASPMFENGKITGTRGIILDMSSHIAMENALKESEEKYRTLIEKAVDGIIITQNGKLKFVNQSFCELVQYSENELLEKPYTDFVVPEFHKMMNNYHKRRMTGEEFQTMYRSRIYKKDGSLLEVELNTRTSLYNNQPAAFIIVRDITYRLKTEEELRIAKSKLEALNQNLEIRIRENTLKLTEANTQLIRLQKENLQSQFEVLRQQVNPHFLFNSLNVLTSLIKLEPDLAEKFTEHLSKVYRYVLENKDNDLVDLQTELDFLNAYVFLLNIRFMGKIEVNVDIADDKKDLKILPLALQLLIENAIKHNSMSKKNPLKIDILTENEKTLIVENNLQERESHMASTGVGLKNIEHRYYLLEMPAPQFYKTETKFIARIPLRS